MRSDEFIQLKDYIMCMRPFAFALDKLQGDNVSIGYILPSVILIQNKIKAVTPVTGFGFAMKSALEAMFKARFDKILEPNEANKEFIMATLTHPKFSILAFSSQNSYEFYHKMFVSEYLKMEQTMKAANELHYDSEDTERENTNANETDSSELDVEVPCDDFFSDLFDESDSEDNKLDAADIINKFFIEVACMNKKCKRDKQRENVADEVKMRILDDSKFQVIRRMFLRFNTSFPSNGPIERLFSETLLIYHPRRNRLHPAVVEQLLYYKHNKSVLN